MNKPMTEEEMIAGIGSLEPMSRIEIAICSLAGRIAAHGTTMTTPEVVDAFTAMLAAHRAVSVESFLGDALLKNVNTNEEIDRFYAAGGKVALDILQSYVAMGDLASKHSKIAFNLFENALKAEKKNV